jgi:polyhydroxybutyrate depolymerase
MANVRRRLIGNTEPVLPNALMRTFLRGSGFSCVVVASVCLMGSGCSASNGASAPGNAQGGSAPLGSGGLGTANGGAVSGGGATSTSSGGENPFGGSGGTSGASGGGEGGTIGGGGTSGSSNGATGGTTPSGGTAGASPSGGSGGAAGANTDGGNSTGGAAPTGDCPAQSLPVGESPIYTIMSANGITYTYSILVPPGYDPTKPTKTTIFWHALTSNPDQTRSLTDIDQQAANYGMIMVYPKSPDASWDAGGCCTQISGGKRRDETVFAKELIAQVESKVCVDKKRLYTTGFSNGGMLSHMFACKMADVFAASAPASGALTIPEAQCTPSRPIPIYMTNGTADPLVPYSTASAIIGSISVTDTFANWGKLNGCTGTPVQTFMKGAVTCNTYQQCGAGTTATLCSVQGMGHCEPGMKSESATNCLTVSGIALGPPNNDIDGVQTSLEFLSQQSMP